jgi:hypothetical protein
MKTLDEQKGPLAPQIKRMANLFGATPRTVRRWLTLYRRNPDPISLLHKRRGPQLGHRRLPIAVERVVGEVIDAWSLRAEPLPVSWSVEESARRCKAIALKAPSRQCPRMLISDEIQHLLSCTSREQRAALNAIKYLANQLRMSIVAAGTHEALHVMRFDPQIASRFEQVELPIWTESEELWRLVAGYLALLPIKKMPKAIDKRFVEYLLELTDGVTGRIIDVLQRAATHSLTLRSKTMGLEELQYVGARLPTIMNQRALNPL